MNIPSLHDLSPYLFAAASVLSLAAFFLTFRTRKRYAQQAAERRAIQLKAENDANTARLHYIKRVYALERPEPQQALGRILAYGPDGVAVVEYIEHGCTQRVTVSHRRQGPGRVIWTCENCFVRSVTYGVEQIRIEEIGTSETVPDLNPSIYFSLEVVHNSDR